MIAIKTYYELTLRDAKGKIISRTGKMPSHSYLLQFLQLIYGFFAHVNQNGKDVDGATTRIVSGADPNVSAPIYYGRSDPDAGDDTYGIVVGTNAGTTAEDNENYVLDTKIEHSAVGAAGKLNYQAVTFVAPTANGGNVDFDITRTFLNETGSTITVKEIGIIIKNTASVKYHLVLRDVVADEDVLDGYTLTVVYTLRTTV